MLMHTCALENWSIAVTIKDIAKVAGVSHSTVSRALREHPAIAPDTIIRIKQHAEDLGYVPSAVARGLKTNRSNALGVIISRIDDPYFSEILQAIDDESQAAGYSLFVAADNRDLERLETIIQTMSERRVDGIIVCSGNVTAEHGRQLQQHGIPIVAVDNQTIEDYQYSISHDHYFGSLQLTQHLIDLGHKKIGYIGNPRSSRANRDRQKAFVDTMTQAGAPVPSSYIFNGPNGRLDGGEAGGDYFFALPDTPTAMICFNDLMAIGLMHVFRERNFSVPNDCSVVGFDNIAISAYTTPPLSTFEQPKYELGYAAARMMMSLLNKELPGDQATKTEILRGTVILRESTAPPKS
ncbi:MAG TPA: LacI family DNA-binding transcriptional regulator [Anaerolineales bacterium]|nr:LacI family DNA-binding transcriptional regulator [Anaerolineales bacterium]